MASSLRCIVRLIFLHRDAHEDHDSQSVDDDETVKYAFEDKSPHPLTLELLSILTLGLVQRLFD